jgi:hypothetical protein
MRTLALAAALMLASVGGCALVIGTDGYETGNGTGSSSSSGAGGAIPCMTAKDCPGSDGACSIRKCAGTCSVENLPKGTPVMPDPSPGDCASVACNGKGGIISLPDAADIPKTADDCLRGTCKSGKPTFVRQPAGTPCGATSITQCDGNGVCTGCLKDGDCGKSDACFSYQCTSKVCLKNPTSGPCGVPPSCTGGVEVLQNTCVNDFCVPSGTQTCAPYVCQGDVCGTMCSSDQDCEAGLTCSMGSCGSPRGNGSLCQVGSDCASANCIDNVCCDSTCPGPCSACTAALKGNGQDGVCGALAAGTPCGPPACDATASGTQNAVCDGSMACVAMDASCNGFLCASGFCLTTCVTNAECAPGYKCMGGCCPACSGWLASGATVTPCTSSEMATSNLKGCACSGNCDSACPKFCTGIGTDGGGCDACLMMNCQAQYDTCINDN